MNSTVKQCSGLAAVQAAGDGEAGRGGNRKTRPRKEIKPFLQIRKVTIKFKKKYGI